MASTHHQIAQQVAVLTKRLETYQSDNKKDIPETFITLYSYLYEVRGEIDKLRQVI